jgi:hypothetical protein
MDEFDSFRIESPTNGNIQIGHTCLPSSKLIIYRLLLVIIPHHTSLLSNKAVTVKMSGSLINMVQLVERKLAGETEILQRSLGSNKGRRGGKPATSHLSYGIA